MSVRLESVTVTYPDGDGRRTVLDRVDLAVAPGEFVGLTGPSGSGKSTLLAVAGGLLRPDSGRVWIGDTELTGRSTERAAAVRRRSIGIVFQDANLLPSLTAVDQLLFATALRGGRPAQRRERARALLEEVGVAARAGRRPEQLSGGERQRVAIARALMNEPAVLLVDEPTASIDPAQTDAVMRLLAEQTRRHGCALVMVTHDPAAVAACDRVVRMAETGGGRRSA